MIIITPDAVQDYAPARLLPRETEPFPWTVPDEHFFRLLQHEPLQIMSLVSRVAKALKPRGKRQKNAYKHEVMMRLNTLMKRGTLRRFRGHLVSLPNWRPHDGMMARTITLLDMYRGSVNRFKKREIKPSLIAARDKALRLALAPPEKPKAVRRLRKPIGPPPTAFERSAAAGVLAKRERPKVNKWAGCFRGQRIGRGAPFRLINGDVRSVVAIRGGKIYVLAKMDSGRILDAYALSEVSRIKHPEAVLLGHLKRGVKERPSAAKAEAARRNGCLPPRPGSRPRGRPRRGAGAGLTPCG